MDLRRWQFNRSSPQSTHLSTRFSTGLKVSGMMLPLMPLDSLVLALGELSMSFIRFANDFLSLLPR